MADQSSALTKGWARPPTATALPANQTGMEPATSGDIIGSGGINDTAPKALNLGIGIDTNPDPGVDFTYELALPTSAAPWSPPLDGDSVALRTIAGLAAGVPSAYFSQSIPVAGQSMHIQPMNGFDQAGNSTPLNNFTLQFIRQSDGASVSYNAASGAQSMAALEDGDTIAVRFQWGLTAQTVGQVGSLSTRAWIA